MQSKGFSLLETIMAISVIALTITASAQLTASSLRNGRGTLDRFAAYKLAEEGLEIVRVIRDSNWLRNREWREGLAEGAYVVGTGPPFSLQQAAFGSSRETVQRRITLSTRANALHVESAVIYGAREASRTVSLSMELTNWKKGPL